MGTSQLQTDPVHKDDFYCTDDRNSLIQPGGYRFYSSLIGRGGNLLLTDIYKKSASLSFRTEYIVFFVRERAALYFAPRK